MKTGKAFVAGVAGAALMSVLMFLARTVMGMEVHLEMMLGTMIGLAPGTTAWIVGFVMHLMLGGVFALGYAWAFENLLHRAGAGAGALLGLPHVLAAGLAMGLIPMLHPLIPEQMSAPGVFMSSLGAMGVVAEVVLHVIYGAVVGVLYGPVHVPAGRPALGTT